MLAARAQSFVIEGCTCPGPYIVDTTCPIHGDMDDDD